MVNDYACYKCYCDKCGFTWVTQGNVLPKHCGKCKTLKWNEKQLGSYFDGITRADVPPKPAAKPTVPASSKFDGMKVNDAMEKFLVKTQVEALENNIEEVEAKPVDEWQFNPKEKPQYNNDGNVYRQQWLAPKFKRSRTVEVQDDDHSKIIRII